MDAKRLILTPILAVAVLSAAVVSVLPKPAAAEVPLPQVSPYLRAAIKAEAKARGYKYAGDIRFDSMYAAPGDWVSSVQSVGPDGAVVTFGKFASDEIVSTTFVRKGEYGWVNPASGVGSPERVPLLAAQPATAPRSWVVEGVNFAPNSEVALFDGTAGGGEQRVPTDHQLAVVKTDANGGFKATVQFAASSRPVPGQVHRLIQTTGGAFLQLRFDQEVFAEPSPGQPSPTQPAPAEPTKPVPGSPVPADPTPAAPATGDSGDGSDTLAYAAAAALGVVVIAGVFGIAMVTRRK